MVNNIVLMGRLTADPELRHTQSGNAVASFTLAVNRDFEKDAADFIPCVAWRQTGEFISKYFRKGSMIAVVGRLQTRKWDDKDGKSRTAYEVIVSVASFTGEKKADTGGGATEFYDVGNDGELPF